MSIRIRVLWLLFSGLMPGIMTISCNRQGESEKIIVTCVPITERSLDLKSAGERYIANSRLLMIDRHKPSSPEVLTGDFYSACAPEISWDGKILLFSGQKKENGIWQIWKMDLKTHELTQITNDTLNCLDPVSLPTGKIIYSKPVHTSATEVIELFAVNADGTDPMQLTYHPHNNLAASILKDGRLISITRQLTPVLNDPYLMVLRPDGSKADLFYQGKPHSTILSKVRESNDGKIFFIESGPVESKGMIVSVNYNRPLFPLSTILKACPAVSLPYSLRMRGNCWSLTGIMTMSRMDFMNLIAH